MAVPAVAHSDMTDLVAQDDVDDLATAPVADRNQFIAYGRRGIESPRLQGARHQGQAGQQVAAGFFSHVPQAGVRRKVAIGNAEFAQVCMQQLEMQSFFTRYLQPVQVKSLWHAFEAPDNVQRQVNRIAFNVRQCMQQRGAAFNAADCAVFHLAGVAQFRAGGAAWHAGRLGQQAASRYVVELQHGRQGAHGGGLGIGVLHEDDLESLLAQAEHGCIIRVAPTYNLSL